MVKSDEVFYQVLQPDIQAAPPVSAAEPVQRPVNPQTAAASAVDKKVMDSKPSEQNAGTTSTGDIKKP